MDTHACLYEGLLYLDWCSELVNDLHNCSKQQSSYRVFYCQVARAGVAELFEPAVFQRLDEVFSPVLFIEITLEARTSCLLLVSFRDGALHVFRIIVPLYI